MKLASFLTSIVALNLTASGQELSAKLSFTNLTVSGSDFIIRYVDAFDDAGYLNVTRDLKTYEFAAFDSLAFILSPLTDWGYMLVRQNDTITFYNGGRNLKAASKRRTDELLFFNALFKRLGYYKNLTNAAFIRKLNTTKQLTDTVDKLFRNYNQLLDKFEIEHQPDNDLSAAYRQHLKFAHFNLLCFAYLREGSNVKIQNLRQLEELNDSLLSEGRWYDPEYKKLVKNVTTINDILYPEGDRTMQGLNRSQQEFILFSQLRDKFGSVDSSDLESFEKYLAQWPSSQFASYLKPYYQGAFKNPSDSGSGSYLNENVYTTAGQLFQVSDILKNKHFDFFILDFWASWCGPCRASIPALLSKKKELEQINVGTLFLSTDVNHGAWINAIKVEGLELEENFIFPNFTRSKFLTTFGIASIPRYMLVDKSGNVLNSDLLSPTSKEFFKTVKRLILR